MAREEPQMLVHKTPGNDTGDSALNYKTDIAYVLHPQRPRHRKTRPAKSKSVSTLQLLPVAERVIGA